MARRHQPPMTPEQIQREIDNWNSVYDSGLISYEKFQGETTKLQRLLARREREMARHAMPPRNQELLERLFKRLQNRPV